MRPQWMRICAVMLIGWGLVGCGPNKTYEESERDLRQIIDKSLEVGLEGKAPPPAKPKAYPELCTESRKTEYYPDYEYHFPLEVLGANPEAFVDRVENYWKSQDVTLDPDDSPGFRGLFGTTKDGNNLQVFVNRDTGMALLAGSGTCAPR